MSGGASGLVRRALADGSMSSQGCSSESTPARSRRRLSHTSRSMMAIRCSSMAERPKPCYKAKQSKTHTHPASHPASADSAPDRLPSAPQVCSAYPSETQPRALVPEPRLPSPPPARIAGSRHHLRLRPSSLAFPVESMPLSPPARPAVALLLLHPRCTFRDRRWGGKSPRPQPPQPPQPQPRRACAAASNHRHSLLSLSLSFSVCKKKPSVHLSSRLAPRGVSTSPPPPLSAFCQH